MSLQTQMHQNHYQKTFTVLVLEILLVSSGPGEEY